MQKNIPDDFVRINFVSLPYNIGGMDSKLTLSFDKTVIEEAKDFTKRNGLSMSRLIEHLLRRATSEKNKRIEEFPISDWVMELMDGPVEYRSKPLSKKDVREAYYEGKASKHLGRK